MSGAPYSTVFSPLNPSFIDWPLASFLASSGTVPTATGYAQYMVSGNSVNIQFRYTFVTVGTGSYRLNLPIAISSTYGKPQGNWYVRYATSGSGQNHMGFYNENTTILLNLVASTTYGGIPVAFTSASPNAGLATGDIVFGELNYIID